ncbi:MAG: bi-domain-containing oxidoreductase [Chloroflexi bacterium]|nr:bi-domain-containing oxidoreductase [Chloroflexota bacterium]
MKQVLINRGRVAVVDVPAPMVVPGTLLIAVSHSCISVGTELSGIRSGAKPLWKRALEQPDNVKKVLNMLLKEGISNTKNRIGRTFDTERPTGYSLAGTVLEVGDGIADIHPRDAVACAGAQYAYHAEIVRVPRNLVTPLPAGLGFAEASTVTLGAIAMQGVRRLQPTLGECFAVLGLGVLGQLVVQLLKTNGCRVVGADLDTDRVKLACSLGMNMGLNGAINQVEQVNRLTGGIGADGVVVTAATASSEVLSMAFQMCRKKGRVVVLGDVGLNIKRSDIYQKELDFFISTSYGPGRYDQIYEEQGLDYPVPYVRWTENRNMAAYLQLVSEGRVNVTKLISTTYPLEDAPKAYADLQQPGAKPLIALLSYPEPRENVERRIEVVPSDKKTKSGKIRIAVVGAGSFARGTHLPNLQKLSSDYEIRAVCSHSGHNAISVSRQFQAGYAATDYGQILTDPDVDAVLIATRHILHADMALQALKAGKHVLVEKPLAMNQTELDTIITFYEMNPDGPVLLTGFNRRFSPHIECIKEITDKRINPMIINYRMNAGYISLDHWVHSREGGGRNIGEACHIYDLFTFLTDSRVTKVSAQYIHPKTEYYSSRDNFICVTAFDDGSLATLTYTALGTKDYPKEKMDVYVDGQVLVMDDYISVEVVGSRRKGMKAKVMDKGLEEELRLFAEAVKGDDKSWPNPLWQQIQAMEIALRVEDQLNK